MPAKIDLTGRKFGKLTVISEAKDLHGHLVWNCVCECGKNNKKPIFGYALKHGIRTHCGCEGRSRFSNRTHGKSETKLYKVWSSMKHRCLNPNDQYFFNYGGRGISVCKEWLSFEPFNEWAMGNGYAKGLTIERIDNDGNYFPENCTWIPKTEQSSNTRKCVMLTYGGKTMNLTRWAKELGVPFPLLQGRKKRGWSDEKTIVTPAVPKCFAHGKKLTFCGVTKSGSGWARELGISISAIHRRLEKHGSIEEVIRNSNAEIFKRMVQEATGIPTFVEG